MYFKGDVKILAASFQLLAASLTPKVTRSFRSRIWHFVLLIYFDSETFSHFRIFEFSHFLPQPDLIVSLWNFYIEKTFFNKSLLEGDLNIVFAVDQE